MTLGACFGDVAGAPSEYTGAPAYANDPSYDLRKSEYDYTDDSVLTCMVGHAFAHRDLFDPTHDHDVFADALSSLFARAVFTWPDSGYGSRFLAWSVKGNLDGSETLSLDHAETSTPPSGLEPYGSYGNGSAMRVSPIGWLYDNEKDIFMNAVTSAACTHDHPEGIRGAVAIAMAVFAARTTHDKKSVKQIVEKYMNFHPEEGLYQYDLDRTVDDIINTGYEFDVSCQGSVPEAICAFLDPTSVDYVSTLRNTIRLGGDADTQCAMSGAIAEAMWGMPADLMNDELVRLKRSGLSPYMMSFIEGCPAYQKTIMDA
jgi:ADP-ribosylglycohydrolase